MDGGHRSGNAEGAHQAKPDFIVRGLPKWEEFEPPESEDIVAYLREYCYYPADEASWETAPSISTGPRLQLKVESHEEIKGHTWYQIKCILEAQQDNKIDRICWSVPRRLTQLREDLQLPIKKALGSDDYSTYFGDAPFARTGGLPGTTGRLYAWCCALAACITNGGASPAIVARALYFLDLPETEMFDFNDNVGANAEIAGMGSCSSAPMISHESHDGPNSEGQSSTPMCEPEIEIFPVSEPGSRAVSRKGSRSVKSFSVSDDSDEEPENSGEASDSWAFRVSKSSDGVIHQDQQNSIVHPPPAKLALPCPARHHNM